MQWYPVAPPTESYCAVVLLQLRIAGCRSRFSKLTDRKHGHISTVLFCRLALTAEQLTTMTRRRASHPTKERKKMRTALPFEQRENEEQDWGFQLPLGVFAAHRTGMHRLTTATLPSFKLHVLGRIAADIMIRWRSRRWSRRQKQDQGNPGVYPRPRQDYPKRGQFSQSAPNTYFLYSVATPGSQHALWAEARRTG